MAPPDHGRVARLLRDLMREILHLGLRIEIEGREHLQIDGAAIVVFNHLSLADGPMVASLLPRKGVFLIAREFDRIPILNWWIRSVADPIYINRGVPDRRAVRRALAVLEEGVFLCMAPEGRISPTGALTEAHNGAAVMGKLAAATVIPIAAYGQENFWRPWFRLRRPRVRVIIGKPFDLPCEQSRDNTAVLMRRIAELLPPRYRGFYDTA